MAKTESEQTFTQLTVTGATTDLEYDTHYGAILHVKHDNGTGTPTVAANIAIECKSTKNAGAWKPLRTLSGSLVATQVDTWNIDIPVEYQEVRIDYTAPTGTTSHTLDGTLASIPTI